jgi:hypothetical protein
MWAVLVESLSATTDSAGEITSAHAGASFKMESLSRMGHIKVVRVQDLNRSERTASAEERPPQMKAIALRNLDDAKSWHPV